MTDEEKIYSLLRDCDTKSGLNSDILLQTVLRAKKEGLIGEETTQTLQSEINQQLEWMNVEKTDASSLPPHAQQELKRKSLELKMHLVAATLGVDSTGGIKALEEQVRPRNEERPSLGAIWHRSGGIVTAKINRQWIVLLPPLSKETSEVVIQEVQKGCLELFESTKLEEGWIVDCSAVEFLPLLLFGSLLGYRTTFEEWNASLSLCWLKQTAFPLEETKSAEKFFDLYIVGDFWFSKKIKKV